MPRAKFTQSDIDRISKAAAKSGVPIVAEFVGSDGSKITVTAGKGAADDQADVSDLDKWLRERDANSLKGHKQ